MNETLPALEELGEQFERAAFAADGRRRPPGRARVVVIALIALLAAAAAALAATGLLSGPPVANPPGFVPRAHAGVGEPVPSQTMLLPLRVADPAGGLPWGIRILRTTRGMGCLQVGRVFGGQLGVLGRDGAFADDGRFHDLPSAVLSQTECGEPDAVGHVFLAVSYQGLPVGGLDGYCRAEQPPQGFPVPPGGFRVVPTCPAPDERIVYYGLLGPRAASITYQDDVGHRVTQTVSGPEGAYLVVLRPPAKRPARGGFVSLPSPASGLVSVQYRDAPTCTIRSPRLLGGARQCPPVGYVAPQRPRVTAAEVTTPVHATFAPHAVTPIPRGAAPAGVPRQWLLTVTFRARRSGDAESLYIVSVSLPRPCAGTLIGPVDHDVAAGAIVRDTEYIPARCIGTVSGQVTYRPRPATPDQMPFAIAGRGGLPVGSFEAHTPR